MNVNSTGAISKRRSEIAKGNTRSIADWVKAYRGQIEKALPSVMTPDRFVRICQTALSTNPQLLQCSETSFIGAMMNAAQLGLEPNSPLGQAYLIPYWSGKKQCYECSFQLGYKGILSLVYRSGEVVNVSANTVYENDFFEYELGLDPKLVHKPALTGRGDVRCYYATWKGKSGGFGMAVMSAEDVRKHALKFTKQKSGGNLTGVWASNFDAMAKKTVLIQALKYAPLSTELNRDLAQDETIKQFDPKQEEFSIAEAPSEFIDAEFVEDSHHQEFEVNDSDMESYDKELEEDLNSYDTAY